MEAKVLHYDHAERTDDLGGRMREESQYHCAHGDLHVYNKILDWKLQKPPRGIVKNAPVGAFATPVEISKDDILYHSLRGT